MLLKAKQLDVLLGSVQRAVGAFSISASGSALATTAMTGKVSGGNSTTVGVVTSAPANRIQLIRQDTSEQVTDDAGLPVFGRLTEAAGVWTVTYFASDGAGGESAFTFTTEDAVGKVIDIKFVEIKQLKDIDPLKVADGLDFVDESEFSSAAHSHSDSEYFTPTAAQTAFTLSTAPKFDNAVQFFVNGQNMSDRMTVVGTAGTYDATDFALETTDKVWFDYEV